MTSYAAYDKSLPCKNPSCKSHGTPHPNCQCYGGMADGGEVDSFCSENRPHDPGCELFTTSEAAPLDPQKEISGYLAHSGLNGLIQMSQKVPENALYRYQVAIQRGHKRTKEHIEKIFNNEKPEKIDDSKAKKDITNWINRGGITDDVQQEIYNQVSPTQFAAGGKVEKTSPGVLHQHPVATAHPEQNVLLQAAKGRMSQYLTGLRPEENAPRLAFDASPDDRRKKKSYEKAVNIAANPLHILSLIQNGMVEPEDVGHFRGLYPEFNDQLQKQLTEKIVESQMSGKKPPLKVRQGLSLLMGVPLSTELTPAAITAVQSIFQIGKDQKSPPQGSPSEPKKHASSLTKSDQSFLTQGQSLESRQQRQK